MRPTPRVRDVPASPLPRFPAVQVCDFSFFYGPRQALRADHFVLGRRVAGLGARSPERDMQQADLLVQLLGTDR